MKKKKQRTSLFFAFENIDYPEDDDEFFYSISPNADLPTPSVGDIINFEDDSNFIEKHGSKNCRFKIINREFFYSREKSSLDEYWVKYFIKKIDDN